MLLSPQDAALFFKLHRSLLCFVNERLQLVPGIDTPDQFAWPAELRMKLRDALVNELDLIESFVDQNPFELPDDELDIVASWRHMVAGKFFILRYLRNYAVFLDSEQPASAYGVLALAEPLEDVIGPHLPIWTDAVLLPFRDQIVYDGLLNRYNISFGPGIRRGLNESYREAKQERGIITSLPAGAAPAAATKQPRKSKPKPARASADEVRDVLDAIVGLIDQFCREHLNEEYAVLCRALAEKLARKRPSPLLSGKPNTWACGIVRTIGWVNFLDDRSQRPYLKLTAIDQAFGVGASTGQGKSMLIRKMFKIRHFDHHWTLPSRLDDNPLVWMLEVNGFLMDIRDCPREAQAIAFQKGLIPYIPADRGSESNMGVRASNQL